MRENSPCITKILPDERYRSPDIPLSAIRRFAQQIGERFRPDKIILFGSYAYGKPHGDSDVDLLVIMPAVNQTNQAIRVRLAFPAPFPLDLIVRTPENLRRAIAEGNWFLSEITSKGKILYDARDPAVDSQSRTRSPRRKTSGRRRSEAS
jgi:predicted nucleotidyltransferase